jgi:hypothetical protein
MPVQVISPTLVFRGELGEFLPSGRQWGADRHRADLVRE